MGAPNLRHQSVGQEGQGICLDGGGPLDSMLGGAPPGCMGVNLASGGYPAHGSSGMAYDQQARSAREHKADLPSLALARVEPGGKHLRIYAGQLALQPHLRPL